MRPKDRTAAQVMADIAGTAHGVAARAELLAAGLSVGQIKQRLKTGALLPEHPGVYRVGHRAPNVEARYMAAVRACGDGALLSGRAAGHAFGLLRGAAPAPEVTARTERRVEGSGPGDHATWTPETQPDGEKSRS